jgi:hypothetical protein
MAPEIAMDQQRPAQFVFSRHVEKMLHDIRSAGTKASGAKPAQPKHPAAAE